MENETGKSANELQQAIIELGLVLKKPDQNNILYGYIPAVLHGVYESRKSLIDDAKHTTALLTTMCGAAAITAGFGFIRLAAGYLAMGSGLLVVSATVFILVAWVISTAELHKLYASYDLYIAASVHAACTFRAMGIPITHKWLMWGDPDNEEYVGTYTRIECGVGKKDQLKYVFLPTKSGGGSQKPEGLRQMSAAWRYHEPNLLTCFSRTIKAVRAASYVFGTLLILVTLSLTCAGRQTRAAVLNIVAAPSQQSNFQGK